MLPAWFWNRWQPEWWGQSRPGSGGSEHVTKSSKVSCTNKSFINKVSSYKFHILLLHQIVWRKYWETLDDSRLPRCSEYSSTSVFIFLKRGPSRLSVLTEKKLKSKCSRVMNMSTSSTRPPSCMYCFGELSPMDGTPANMLFPSERDSASSSSSPPPSARFLVGRGSVDG